MSATTYSNMSNPHILISIQAYTHFKLKLTDRLIITGDQPAVDQEKEIIRAKVAILDQLIDACVNEYAKRDIS